MTVWGGGRDATRADVIAAAALDGLDVEECPREGALRLTHWERLDPAIACGITTAARGDYGVAGVSPARVRERYAALADELGFGRVSVPSQIHGTRIREVPPGPSHAVGASVAPSVEHAGPIDGQLTGVRGCLLAATAADCVPVSLWHPASGRIGLVHAGWRGTAAGILARALGDLREGADGADPDVRVHLGPAICGRCYEVDTPVLRAFGLPGGRARLDLRGLLAAQALANGVRRKAISSSRHCTACGPARLHSHRASGGGPGRMAAFLGRRIDERGVPPRLQALGIRSILT